VEHVVSGHERIDRDVLTRVVRQGRVSRPEVHGVEPTRREVGHVRPGLLRTDLEITRGSQRADGRRVHNARGRRVADNRERRAVGNEPGEKPFRFGGLSIGRVAQVQGRRRLAGDHVVRDASVQACDGDNLAKLEPVDHGAARLRLEERREPTHGALERAVGQPRSGRMAARPVERELRDHVPKASSLDRQVRRLEHDGETGLVHSCRLREQREERIVLGRQLLAPEEQEAQVAGRELRVEAPRELEGDGEAALHIAGTQAVHGAAGDAAWSVPLRGNSVVVRHEQDQRRCRAARRDEQERFIALELGVEARRHQPDEVLPDRRLAPALRRDVDELERPHGKPVCERGHSRSVPGHNPAVTARQPDPAPGAEAERAFLVGVYPKGTEGLDELAELRELARTSGAAPAGEIVQHRARPDVRTFVGKGKLAELKAAYAAASAEVVLADDELSPTQQRALEDELGARVVDRTQLILDIFAQHARSSEGKLQVELAQLEYNLPRMRGMWKHLERLGGGVGTRGPGESQLETDRRLARTRVSLLKRRLRGLQSQRSTRRKERLRSTAPTIALAGYTNVGKSTLLNALTGAGASVDDRLFETLDPTTRGFEHDGKRYLVTDTVGFIRRLPTQLVEGFAATLEETLVADLILHVADGSLPEARLAETIAAVGTVLAEIGADDIPVELVLNKVDVLDPLGRRRIEHSYPRALLISAHTGEGIDELMDRIAELFSDRFEDVRLLVPYSDGRALTALYELGAPIAERRDTADGVHVRARLPRAEAARFARYLVDEGPEWEVSAT
jgi:GTP-binding protein HflX